ncbi:uncharacterized protein BT62DRAFT_445292 [Guyanagaster necrorhizus]|uniref:Uncharacterized protein n=1 Tax=Guyanagaster necrorhizus TaxID=856835 RepID=A0A9P7VJM8_9AGAR|nr:uncharacterized protein BT62DRAFT_445292 [Guyanagaster necrorhizus MCA 3950]KAG7442351.1 hypothetical protein BT62DRAFT_445292 [Guyanagaster necrorhizus MCA 3950]
MSFPLEKRAPTLDWYNFTYEKENDNQWLGWRASVTMMRGGIPFRISDCEMLVFHSSLNWLFRYYCLCIYLGALILRWVKKVRILPPC